jgi:imidazolonepropionase-like amidohydrolase
MKTMKTILTIATLAALSLAAMAQSKKSAAPAGSGALALKGGKVMTITKGTIENGVVVMENGKITAVGAASAVAIPKGARVIDVTGMTVYPGLIDSHTRLGLTEISAVDMTNDTQEPSDPITPQIRVADAFHAESELIPVARLNGITNAIVSPTARNTLPGQLSFIQLDGKDRDEMLMVQDLALPLNFNGRQRRNESFANSRFPSTRMGVAAQLRQALIDAQDYGQKWGDYEKKLAEWNSKPESERKDRPSAPKRDLKLESLQPYLKRERPVVLTADTTSDVKVALELAREFNLKVILSGVMRADSMFDEIAALKVPVVLGEIYDSPRSNQRYDAIFRVPAELAKRGVKIAFASYDSHQVRNLPYAAGYAVAYGLPYEEAMKALTIYPAEIWGVADRLGSLEAGKVANVVVANGDPLELKTDVKMVFIQGHEVPMVSKQTQLRDAYAQR